MKYDPSTLLYLLLLLSLTMFIGLFITQGYTTMDLPYDLEPVSLDDGFSVAYFVAGIIVISFVFYMLTRLKYEKFLRLWFSVAIIVSLSVSLTAFIGEVMGLILALILTILRLSTRDLYVHNFTELFVYGGIASIFAPLFDPLSVIILLIIISVYDYVSVFVTKHMIYLAKTQESVNVFTGLMIKREGETAILGGGDIAFSLIFASVLGQAVGVVYAYFSVYLVISAIALLSLLGTKGKFYPAMPFITVACLISYLIALI